jgi:hypothetical protein
MPVSNPEVVDFIALNKAEDVVELVMVESRDWKDQEKQTYDLYNKVNTYVAFCQQGPLASQYPAYVGKRVRFNLYSAYAPLPAFYRFFANISQQITPLGFSFHVFVGPDPTTKALTPINYSLAQQS